MPANNSTDLRNGQTGELGTKGPCLVATTTNITLEGLQTVNGVALAANNIVLVRSQTDKTENGIYIASTSSWQRAVWFDDELDAVPGTLVITTNGTDRSHTLWETVCTDNPIQFGTSEIEFRFFQTSGGEGNYLVATNNLSDVENAATSRSNLGLAIGSNVQAYNANLASIAGLTLANNKLIGASGAGTAVLYTIGTASGNIPTVGTSSATESLAGLIPIATQFVTDVLTNDTTAITPKKLGNGFALSATTNGYIKLPSWLGGFTIQWGSATTGGTVTFPTEFTTLFAVNITLSSNAAVKIVGINAASKTTFQAQSWNNNGTGSSGDLSLIHI